MRIFMVIRRRTRVMVNVNLTFYGPQNLIKHTENFIKSFSWTYNLRYSLPIGAININFDIITS